MTLEVRQLVLRAKVRDEPDEDGEEDDDEACSCGEEIDACEDMEALKEDILAACRAMLREELRALRRER